MYFSIKHKLFSVIEFIQRNIEELERRLQSDRNFMTEYNRIVDQGYRPNEQEMNYVEFIASRARQSRFDLEEAKELLKTIQGD